MAQHLASIYGTEKDKVNCSFYFKTGACRHGDGCSRKHNVPSFSQTILLKHFYTSRSNMASITGSAFEKIDAEEDQKEFDEFYEEVYRELNEAYGPVEEMHVCENLGDHILGNVYVLFETEEIAAKALESLNNRWFNGRHIEVELSPVTDFREASCSQHQKRECTRTGYCNFMHIKSVSRSLMRRLEDEYRNSRGGRRRTSRTPSPIGRNRNDDRRRRSRSRDRRSRR